MKICCVVVNVNLMMAVFSSAFFLVITLISFDSHDDMCNMMCDVPK